LFLALFSFVAMVLALVFQISSVFFKKQLYFVAAVFNLAAGTLIILELGLISIQIGMAALTNMYEALLFFVACIQIALAVFLLRGSFKKFQFVPIVSNIFSASLVLLALTPVFINQSNTVPEALRSLWLVLHVGFAITGDAFFFLGFVASLFIFFYKDSGTQQKLDRLAYFFIVIGYVLFTLGALIFGAIWAEQAWGRFWGWDPKETWAFITWLTYSAYLHMRFVKKIKIKILALVSVLGFLFTLFTFFGVNYLLEGLHSY
jgi:ABC-type transport system involved in cytochrome c biogenesis permease subunit